MKRAGENWRCRVGLADDAALCRRRAFVYRPSARVADYAPWPCAAQHFSRRRRKGRNFVLCRAVYLSGRNDRDGKYRGRRDGNARRRTGGAVLDAPCGGVRHGDAVCRGLSLGEIPRPAERTLAGRAVSLYRARTRCALEVAGRALCGHRRGGGDPRCGDGHAGQQHYLCGGELF